LIAKVAAMGIGWRELVIVLVIVLLVFGTKRLKNVGSDLGEAVRGFKKGMNGDEGATPPKPDAGRSGDQLRDDNRKD
jgi:sec-independent protein translocase protein TatA